MDEETLYIIGNGFDLHHGIPSKYSDFEQYLLTADRALHDRIQEYIPVEENWSDLEARLADIDAAQIVDATSMFLKSYGADDWRDSDNHDFQYETSNIVEALSTTLKLRFGEWIRQLEIPFLEDLPVCPLRLPTTARYLTFNYTSTLTDIYRIPSPQILHIHGEAKKQQDLVLGHAWNPKEIPSLNEDADEDSDPRLVEGNSIIDDYFGQTFKDTQRMIKENRRFFDSLANLSKIMVLGHSLSPVDEPYFREIVARINVNRVRWIVTYHEDQQREEHRNTLLNIGVPEIVISHCTMNGLQDEFNLRLPI